MYGLRRRLQPPASSARGRQIEACLARARQFIAQQNNGCAKNRNEIQSSKGVFGRVRYALWGTPGYPPGHDLPTGIVYPWYRTIPIVTFVV